jgi:lipoyl(octanoyl) transferase
MLTTQDWGIIEYRAALERQLELVKARQAGAIADTIVFCTHPPVVTTGRGTQPSDIRGWRGELVEISRGGRATYHGPNQEIVYPILDLSHPRAQVPGRDLHAYMASLEAAVIQTLQTYEVKAQTSKEREASYLVPSSNINAVGKDKPPSFTGVWVGEKKIASIGIAVSRWVSYHGVAINVADDPSAFQGLNPCGFQASTMTSLEAVTVKTIDRLEFREILKKSVLQTLDF